MIELLTAILVIITGFYAWVTFKMLKANENVLLEMQTQREDLIRPYVDISISMFPDNPIFYLKIINSGKTAASNLKLTLDRDFFKVGEQKESNNLRNFNVFNNSINSFSPNTEILLMLAQGFKVFADDANEAILPKRFSITASYQYGNSSVTEETNIDLTPYLNSLQPYDSVVTKLKEIKQAIEKK
jgi:hypothetical protein